MSFRTFIGGKQRTVQKLREQQGFFSYFLTLKYVAKPDPNSVGETIMILEK